MRIAIVGSGISGLVTAYLLSQDHDITVFEAADYIGGHTHTLEVDEQGRKTPVDTGFIVFNDWTYPNFCRLLDRLGVASQPSDMSFSVTSRRTGLEYQGSSVSGLFAQRANLLRPSHYRFLAGLLRFNRAAKRLARRNGANGHGTDACRNAAAPITLREFAAASRIHRDVLENYVLPMGSSIWSADPERFMDFPAEYMAEFYENHGMLNLFHCPQWRVVQGGSHEYVKSITRSFRERIRLRCPVAAVTRSPEGVLLRTATGSDERFDAVVLACHSDQALALLADPTPQEREILGAIPYHANATVLHTDTRLLPTRRRAWASWNYLIPAQPRGAVTMTYNMNMLQSLATSNTYCVSLNAPETICDEAVIERMTYHHPVYSPAGVAAQKRHDEINGRHRTWFCGAYWGYGFHEDGVNSALAVCRHFGKSL